MTSLTRTTRCAYIARERLVVYDGNFRKKLVLDYWSSLWMSHVFRFSVNEERALFLLKRKSWHVNKCIGFASFCWNKIYFIKLYLCLKKKEHLVVCLSQQQANYFHRRQNAVDICLSNRSLFNKKNYYVFLRNSISRHTKNKSGEIENERVVYSKINLKRVLWLIFVYNKLFN